jgi:predicted CxxxxCH...CXXCH cytochrome family protein
MNRHHSDPRYYTCSNAPCHGAIGQIGRDLQQRPVWQCTECGRRYSDGMLKLAYRQLRQQD